MLFSWTMDITGMFVRVKVYQIILYLYLVKFVTLVWLWREAWNLVADFFVQKASWGSSSLCLPGRTTSRPWVLMEAKLPLEPYVGRKQGSCKTRQSLLLILLLIAILWNIDASIQKKRDIYELFGNTVPFYFCKLNQWITYRL